LLLNFRGERVKFFDKVCYVVNKTKLFIRLKQNKISFSQTGEDLVLDSFIEKKTSGFYIDIGAHDPFRFSNTAIFYQRGWNGINVDMDEENIVKLKKVRKRDQNVCVAISDHVGKVNMFKFEETAINTIIVPKKSKSYQSVKKVKTTTMEGLLNKYLPKNQDIDFMNIDIEGADYLALKSNNWKKFRPKYIIIESKGKKISNFLKKQNYIKVGMTRNSDIYKGL
jgi:FkbM family methyltransferase